MTGKQQAVLWIGLILIAFRFFTVGQWQSIWSAISTAPASLLPKGGSSNGSGKPWWDPTGPFSATPGPGSNGLIEASNPTTIPAPGVANKV